MNRYNKEATEKLAKVLESNFNTDASEIQKLIEQGADPNGRCKGIVRRPDFSFLERAIENHNYSAVKCLAKSDAKCTESDLRSCFQRIFFSLHELQHYERQSVFDIIEFLCDHSHFELCTAEYHYYIEYMDRHVNTAVYPYKYGNDKGKHYPGDGGDLIFATILLMIEKGIINPMLKIYGIKSDCTLFEYMREFCNPKQFDDARDRMDAVNKAYAYYLKTQKNEKTVERRSFQKYAGDPTSQLWEVAIDGPYEHAVELIKQFRADLNAKEKYAKDKPERSVLEKAVFYGNYEVVQALLENGANTGTSDGHSLFYQAFVRFTSYKYEGNRNNYHQIIKLLCKYGCKTKPEESEFFALGGDFACNSINGDLIYDELMTDIKFMIEAGALDMNASYRRTCNNIAKQIMHKTTNVPGQIKTKQID